MAVLSPLCDQERILANCPPGKFMGSLPIRGVDHLLSYQLDHFFGPRFTIFNSSSASGCCNDLASSHGARIHTSLPRYVRIADIALACTVATPAFGSVEMYRLCGVRLALPVRQPNAFTRAKAARDGPDRCEPDKIFMASD